jgi:FAD/FMN-containing dehydrogenase
MSSFESIQIIKSQFSSEIIDPADKSYANESRVWAAQKNLNPKLVIRPASEESLSKLLKFLSTTSLTIGVRSQGYGNASSKDVLISMTAFDTFSFNSDDKVVTLGAGQPWSGYYERMEKEAPGYTVIACRTPMIGVGGSTLAGGFSWLSAEYGCTSDSENLLDARVVKMDGSIIWASEEPELLWALRGTQGGFGRMSCLLPSSSYQVSQP